MKARRAFLGLALLAAGLTTQSRAAEKGGVFILPVEGRCPICDNEAAVFEERLAIALGESGHVRTVSHREIPADKRSGLPGNLANCTSPDCVKKLSTLLDVERVLAVRVTDDRGQLILFSTVYEGRTGSVHRRKEWQVKGAESMVPRKLAGDIARWTLDLPQLSPPPAFVAEPVPGPGVLILQASEQQRESSAARALLSELTTRLQGYGDFGLFQAGAKVEASHRAIVAVENVNVATRRHKVRHHRDGLLVASLTIEDAASKEIVFSARGRAEATAEVDSASETQVLGTMIPQVVDQWMSAFNEQGIRNKLRRKNKR
jgi:hypothetical protein